MAVQNNSLENRYRLQSRIKRVIFLFQTAVSAAFLLLILFLYASQQLSFYISGDHLADLAVIVTPSAQQVFPGDKLNFLVKISNDGPSNARDVIVVITLPPEVEYLYSSTSENLEVDQSILTWTLSPLLAEQVVQLDFWGGVKSDLSAQMELEIKAEIFSAATDINSENDVSVSRFGVVMPSNLSGIVWGDINRDGVRDVIEAPNQNFAVELYTNQTLVSQTVTDEAGLYQFSNLFPGTYYLDFSTVENVLFSPKDATSDDLDSEPFQETGITELITVTSGQDEENWDAGVYFVQFLPLIQNNFVSAPDLIINRIELDFTSNYAEIEIQNIGNAATDGAFWVDLYIDPQPIPTRTNQPCDISITCTGTLVWGIPDSVSLQPGSSMTISTGDQYFTQSYSTFTSSFRIDMDVYAQVDSDNMHTNYGNILETHEIHGQPYNNIFP